MKYIMERQFDPQGLDEDRLAWESFGTGLWEEDRG